MKNSNASAKDQNGQAQLFKVADTSKKRAKEEALARDRAEALRRAAELQLSRKKLSIFHKLLMVGLLVGFITSILLLVLSYLPQTKSQVHRLLEMIL